MDKTECTWYFSEIYYWNVSSNKARIYNLTLTTKSRRSRSAVFRTPSIWKVHWPMLAVKPRAKTTGGSTYLNSGRANFFRGISHSIYCCLTTRVYQAKIKGWERNCKSNQFFNCRSEEQSGPLGIWWGTGVWLQTILACTVINAKRVTLSLIKRLFGEYDISRVKAVARGNKLKRGGGGVGALKITEYFFLYFAVPENIYTHHKGDLWALKSHFF